jgi:hypothetical protein
MQRATAAGAVLILNGDHHLDARQVAWQRASVRAALRGVRLPLGRRLGFVIGFLTGCDLLDLLKAQQQLVLGKRFGPATEPMTLHLLDDLLEPLGAGALCQQHRLQRRRIVGERICRSRHDPIRSCVTPPREHSRRADSLCRNHPGCIGAGVSRAA